MGVDPKSERFPDCPDMSYFVPVCPLWPLLPFTAKLLRYGIASEALQ